ncbi:MAG TPA: hypothetical protein VM737_03475 [Gemmatimonadota bacterium]|nr:hypothetical protein [Gemmatimonadota bacterium]
MRTNSVLLALAIGAFHAAGVAWACGGGVTQSAVSTDLGVDAQRAIARAIMALGDELGIQVVARRGSRPASDIAKLLGEGVVIPDG